MTRLLDSRIVIILLVVLFIKMYLTRSNKHVNFIGYLESSNFYDIIKDFYDLNNNDLPQ